MPETKTDDRDFELEYLQFDLKQVLDFYAKHVLKKNIRVIDTFIDTAKGKVFFHACIYRDRNGK